MCGRTSSVTAWRTTCLYGVSDSRASPRLYLGAIFVCYIRTARSPRCEWRRWLSCHRMAHCVLIRCYLQPSLSEALPWCYLCLLHTDRTSPRCECVLEGFVCHRMAHLRAYTVFLTAEPRRGSFLMEYICHYHGPNLSEVRVCGRTPSVTAWRTSCLYGVSHSRTSPMYFRWRHLRLLHTDRTSPRCR